MLRQPLLIHPAVLRNPILFMLIIITGGGTYVAYTLNLLGPMMQMGGAAWDQAVDIGKQKLREFVENNEMARQAIALPSKQRDSDSVSLDTLDSRGKKKQRPVDDEDDI